VDFVGHRGPAAVGTLVRPDGHVAWVADGGSPLTDALAAGSQSTTIVRSLDEHATADPAARAQPAARRRRVPAAAEVTNRESGSCRTPRNGRGAFGHPGPAVRRERRDLLMMATAAAARRWNTRRQCITAGPGDRRDVLEPVHVPGWPTRGGRTRAPSARASTSTRRAPASATRCRRQRPDLPGQAGYALGDRGERMRTLSTRTTGHVVPVRRRSAGVVVGPSDVPEIGPTAGSSADAVNACG